MGLVVGMPVKYIYIYTCWLDYIAYSETGQSHQIPDQRTGFIHFHFQVHRSLAARSFALMVYYKDMVAREVHDHRVSPYI